MVAWNARLPGLETWSELLIVQPIPAAVEHLVDIRHYIPSILFNLSQGAGRWRCEICKSQYSMCGSIRTHKPSRPPEGTTLRFWVIEMGGAPKWARAHRKEHGTHGLFADHHESVYNI